MTRRYSIVLTLALVMGVVTTLSAHMRLQKSEPAADSTVTAPLKTVQIWFSEAPDLSISKVTLTGPAGPVKLMGLHVMEKSLMVSIDGDAAPGKYAVAWQSAGDDGHAQKGQFMFTLQAAK